MTETDKRWRTIGAVIILLSLAMQFITTQCGLLLTYDSYQYVAAAASFSAHGTFSGVDGVEYAFWPPFFPVFLSLFPEPASAMKWVNLLLSAVAGFLIWRMAGRTLADYRFRIVFLAAYMWGVHHLLISVFLWSELLFLVLLLAFTECVVKALTTPRALIPAFVFGALLCLQRNAGLFLIPAASLWLLFANRERRVMNLAGAVVVLASALAGAVWNFSNIFGSTAVSEIRFGESIGHNLLVMADAVAHAMMPFTIMDIPFIILLIVLPVTFSWTKRKQMPEPFLFVFYLCFYFAGMGMVFRFDTWDTDRFAAVILPFALMLAVALFEGFHTRGSAVIKRAIMVVMISFILYPAARALKNARQWHESSCEQAVLNGEK